MREAYGNLWDMKRERLVITTNGTTRSDGAAVMGRGIAREAKERFPGLPYILGGILEIPTLGNHTWALPYGLISFPVKDHWKNKASLPLIQRSTEELVALVNRRGWRHVLMPRPGCGNGGLDWSTVKPIIEPHLDNRFTVVTFPPRTQEGE